MTKNVFITGGLGQDAQILINILKKKKINLTILSRTKKSKTLGNVKFIKENLLNKRRLDLIFIKKNQILYYILHLTIPPLIKQTIKFFLKKIF